MNEALLRINLLKLEEYSKHRSYSQDYFERYLFNEIWKALDSSDEEIMDSKSSDDDFLRGDAMMISDSENNLLKEDDFSEAEEYDVVTEEKVLYGGYFPPFFWSSFDRTCIVSDSIGQVLKITNWNHKFIKEIHGPLFDKLIRTLETGVLSDDYPTFYCSLKKSNEADVFYLNDFEVSFIERLGAEGDCADTLKEFVYSTFFSLADIAFYHRLLFLKLSKDDYWQCFRRYLTKTFPYYEIKFELCDELYDAIVKFTRLFYLQSDKEWDDIYFDLQKPLEQFYKNDIVVQKQQDTRLELARKLADCFGVDDRFLGILADSLGYYLSDYNKFFSSISELETWQRKHDLLGDDLLVCRSNWAENVFLFDTYSDLTLYITSVSANGGNVKFWNSESNYYELKFDDFVDQSLLESWYEANKDKKNLNDRIFLPIPFWAEKKNKPEICDWIRMNLFLMGFSCTKKAAKDFWDNFLSIKDTFYSRKTGVLYKNAAEHFVSFLKSIFDSKYCYDRSLLVSDKKYLIPLDLGMNFFSAMSALAISKQDSSI